MDSILRIPSVTGVDVELRIAGPGARSYAFIVDWHIRVLIALAWLLVGMFAIGGAVRALDPTDQGYAAFVYVVALPSAAIYFLYHPVLEVLQRGQTPGKRIAGVRLVTLADGGAPGVGALLIRNVFRLIDSLPTMYAVGLIATMVTKHSVRIGDIAAGTVLVYDEPQSRRLLDELAGPAVQQLGLEQAELARELLRRWPELGADARARLARQLLARLGVDTAAAADAELEARLRSLLA
jgi:uncharacterized RDD family membrane protein YckC